MKKIIFTLLLLFVIVGLFNIYKFLPEGISVEGRVYKVPNESVVFLADKTYLNENGERNSDQEIFDEIFKMIDEAESFILIDMFLFNDFKGKENEAYRELSGELKNSLIDKKSQNPNIEIILITDPINQVYGALESNLFSDMKNSGINVIETDLKKLRDSNPFYSSVWRSILQFLPLDFVELSNPFSSDSEKVGLNSYLTLVNFKANHRKVIVTDYLNDFNELKVSSLITSANPHDGSSAHHNVAIKINDYIWRDIINSEMSVINFSSDIDNLSLDMNKEQYKNESGDVSVQLLTEKDIKESIVENIDNTKSGEEIKLVMFYISEREIIDSIKNAYIRGVDIEIILDPNKDAFGREKNGVPNVSVAREFKDLDKDFKIRWCDTHGEQCHSKLLIVNKQDSHYMNLGSANFTKRNIGDYNLETNVQIWGQNVNAINEANEYFEELWNNVEREYTVNYDKYANESILKYLQYRFMEKTGISSF